MKVLAKNKVILLVVGWLLFLFLTQLIAPLFIPLRHGYLGPIPWANMDGIHYVLIAQRGYVQYEQAFFPLFPLLIHILANLFRTSYLIAGLLIAYTSAAFVLYFFYKLVRLDHSAKIAIWSLVFLLFFPTAFFFVSIYTESLFLALVFASFYFFRKEKYFWSGVLGLLASATRLVGVLLFVAMTFDLFLKWRQTKKFEIRRFIPLLLIPIGSLFYMLYLWIKYQDPLLFVHSQPAFGAGRSGGAVILLPQVLWRYFKILTTIPLSHMDWWVSLLELVTFTVVLILLYIGYRKKERLDYLLFALLAILTPSLSGTLSSLPRYALTSFVIFITLARLKNKWLQYSLAALSLALEGILAALFLRGYFVS